VGTEIRGDNVFLPRLERLDRAELQALQLRKLRQQLMRIEAGNPFYQALWKRSGFDAAGDIRSLGDVRRLPFTSKSDFITDQQAHPPFGSRLGVPLDAVGELTETSGTSGKGKELHGHTTRDMHLRGQMTGMGWAWAGLRPTDIGIFHIPATNSASLYTMLRGIRAVGRLPYLVGHLGFEERLALMKTHGVNAMYMTPSGLNGLTVLCDKLGIVPREAFPGLRFVMVSAESWPVEWVLRTQEIWNTKITEVYGSTQLNAAYGAACCEGGAVVDGRRGCQHLFEWTSLYEVIDPVTTEPVGPGETGELVITHLDKQASPLVRFRSGDRVTYYPYSRCGCGRQLSVIEAGSIGRVDDMLKVKGATIWPSEVDAIVFAHREVGEYQAKVYIGEKGRDEITLLYSTTTPLAGPAVHRLSAALRGELKDRTSVSFSIAHVEESELPSFAHPDKKARRWTDVRHGDLAKEARR
jgi:phenylacetate-CoA ligase